KSHIMITIFLAVVCIVLSAALVVLWVQRVNLLADVREMKRTIQAEIQQVRAKLKRGREVLLRELRQKHASLERERTDMLATVKRQEEELRREWSEYEPTMRTRREEINRIKVEIQELSTHKRALAVELNALEGVLAKLRAEAAIRKAQELIIYASKHYSSDHA